MQRGFPVSVFLLSVFFCFFCDAFAPTDKGFLTLSERKHFYDAAGGKENFDKMIAKLGQAPPEDSQHYTFISETLGILAVTLPYEDPNLQSLLRAHWDFSLSQTDEMRDEMLKTFRMVKDDECYNLYLETLSKAERKKRLLEQDELACCRIGIRARIGMGAGCENDCSGITPDASESRVKIRVPRTVLVKSDHFGPSASAVQTATPVQGSDGDAGAQAPCLDVTPDAIETSPNGSMPATTQLLPEPMSPQRQAAAAAQNVVVQDAAMSPQGTQDQADLLGDVLECAVVTEKALCEASFRDTKMQHATASEANTVYVTNTGDQQDLGLPAAEVIAANSNVTERVFAIKSPSRAQAIPENKLSDVQSVHSHHSTALSAESAETQTTVATRPGLSPQKFDGPKGSRIAELLSQTDIAAIAIDLHTALQDAVEASDTAGANNVDVYSVTKPQIARALSAAVEQPGTISKIFAADKKRALKPELASFKPASINTNLGQRVNAAGVVVVGLLVGSVTAMLAHTLAKLFARWNQALPDEQRKASLIRRGRLFLSELCKRQEH